LTSPASDLAASVSPAQEVSSPVDQSAGAPDEPTGTPIRIPFKEAIEAGALIDVTPVARQLGLSFSVTVTRPLWDTGIVPSPFLSEEERSRFTP
jgi:hypothetical protein